MWLLTTNLMADLNFEATIAPRKGIILGLVWSCVSNLGTVAIEDIETHSLDKLLYERKLNPGKYKGKLVYWESDQFGMLTRLEPVEAPQILDSL